MSKRKNERPTIKAAHPSETDYKHENFVSPTSMNMKELLIDWSLEVLESEVQSQNAILT